MTADIATDLFGLRVSGIDKRFGPNQVLTGVDLEIRAGEIHGFIGGNGSGKSTLIKIMAGIEHAEPGGVVEVQGTRLDAATITPERAHEVGLRFVHQNLGVYPTMTVAENIAIGTGYPTGIGGRIQWSTLRARTETLIERFHIPATPDTPVGMLAPAAKTLVAIARALSDVEPGDRDVLILDEPTASLPRTEVDQLLAHLKNFAAAGQTIVIVSHRLDEILEVADRVSTLRNGVIVDTSNCDDVDADYLAEQMTGIAHAASDTTPVDVASDAGALLRVAGLRLTPWLDQLDFEVRHGEILGVAGLAGSGRSELLQTIFGAMNRAGYPAEHRPSGTLQLDGEDYWPSSTGAAIAAGVAMVGEDRATQSVFIDWTIRTNTTLPWLQRFFRGGRLTHRAERTRVIELMDTFGVKAMSEQDEMWQLSGGNQQKVVMARWMADTPRLLLLDEPTHGVDVSARREIHDLVRRAVRSDAAGAIVVSSDLEELADISDRVVLLHAGRIRAEVTGEDITAANLAQIVNTAGTGLV